MDADEVPEDEGPLLPWISPDDRLWRHPSEMGASIARSHAEQPLRGSRSTVRLWSVAVVAGVVGAVLASGVGVASGSFQHHTTILQPVTRMLAPTSMTVTTAATSHAGSTSQTASSNPNWPGIADAIAPSIVSITSSGPAGELAGSGVLYTSASSTAYILTAASLVGNGVVRVTFDDSETQTAKVVGIDRVSGLGLVAVHGTSRVYPPFSGESSLQIAQSVLNIGAHGPLSGPDVAPASVAALDVAVSTGDNSTMENLIGIDSSSAFHDPGSALVNAQGAVFGIQASVDSPEASATQTYAIPFDVAGHVATQMMAGVAVSHPWLGTFDSKDPSTATMSALSVKGGSQITEVSQGSPAQQAGMQPSDIITSFDGQPVPSTGALTTFVSQCSPGHQATISYLHRGEARMAKVTLADTPSDVDLASAVGGG